MSDIISIEKDEIKEVEDVNGSLLLDDAGNKIFRRQLITRQLEITTFSIEDIKIEISKKETDIERRHDKIRELTVELEQLKTLLQNLTL